MKAYWINTPEKVIQEVEYDGNYKTISGIWLKCDCFTLVYLGNRDAVFVDDEGLINDNPYGWFELRNYQQPLKGYGLVLGSDHVGESTAPKMSLEVLRAVVDFPDYVDPSSIDRTITVRAL